MAKKQESLHIEECSLEQIRGELKKQFGVEIFTPASAVIDRKNKIIPVSPSLDIGLGGGIPEGTHAIFSGPPKCGKTTTILDFCATCQTPEYGNKTIFFGNVEHRLKRKNLRSVRGINEEKFHIIESTKEKILTAQDYLTIFLEILKSMSNVVCVMDSYSRLVTEKQFTDGIGAANYGDVPKLLNSFCEQTAPLLVVNNNIMIGITHQITSMVQGQGKVEKGGVGIKYQADAKIVCKWNEKWTVGSSDDGMRIGNKLHWIIEEPPLNARPYQECVSYLRFGQGVDKVRELVEISCDIGIIDKGGAGWCTMPNGQKVQGMEKVTELISNTPEIYLELNKKVREFFNLES